MLDGVADAFNVKEAVGLTLTVMTPSPLHPPGSSARTVYVVLLVGLTTTDSVAAKELVEVEENQVYV